MQASGKVVEQKVIDFERLEDAGLREGQWDVVFIVCVCFEGFSSPFYVSSTCVEWARVNEMRDRGRILLGSIGSTWGSHLSPYFFSFNFPSIGTS